jgi:glycosyltransferase involved in cell wall biosynthesis
MTAGGDLTLRVLFVASSGVPGGAERGLVTYVGHLPKRVEGSGLVLSQGPIAALLAARLGRPVWIASLEGRPGLRRATAFVRGSMSLLRREQPDVVFARGIKAAVMLVPACRLLGVPLVWHKVDFSWHRSLAPLVAMLCDGVAAVSEATASTLPARRRLGVLPPPVRLDPGFRVSPDRPPATIGSIGRLVPYKGHADVIAAAALLRSRFPEIRVIIAGADDASAVGHRAALEAAARASGLEDRVEILGHVADVERVLERLTVFVQATYRDERGFGAEGFGAAMSEASWAALPVVAATGGGSAEAMQEGVTGRLVPPRDPAALAEAVAAYLADPSAAGDAGQAGARFARERLEPARLTAWLVGALEHVVERSALRSWRIRRRRARR